MNSESMGYSTTPMVRIEIVHHKNALYQLEEWCESQGLPGFFSVGVQSADGDMFNTYRGDHTDPAYYSVIVVEPDALNQCLRMLQEILPLSEQHVMVSPVEIYAPSST